MRSGIDLGIQRSMIQGITERISLQPSSQIEPEYYVILSILSLFLRLVKRSFVVPQ